MGKKEWVKWAMAVSRVIPVLMRYPYSEGRVHASVGLGFSFVVIRFLTWALHRRQTDVGLLWWAWNSLKAQALARVRWGVNKEEKEKRVELWYLYAIVLSAPLQYPCLVFSSAFFHLFATVFSAISFQFQ